MSDASQPLIDKALLKLAGFEAEAAKVKAFINQICEFDGREPMFADVELRTEGGKPRGLNIGPDDFFNKPFATAVREVLAMRADAAAGKTSPASIEEIHAALVKGGFNFPNNDVERQKQGLAVSLGKNTVTFRKLPSGLFGLAEWYGATPKSQRRRKFVTQNGTLVEVETDAAEDDNDLGSNTDANLDAGDPDEDEAAESPISDNSAASGPTPNSADEDGREVEHDNITDRIG